jgi:hypothetical protein
LLTGVIAGLLSNQFRVSFNFYATAHLKRIRKLDQLRIRGLAGAQDDFILTATAQNLKRMAKWLMPISGKAGLMAA